MKFKKIVVIVLIILALLSIGTAFYLSDYSHSEKTLEEYQKQSTNEIAQEGSTLIIKGKGESNTGILFYPGGKVGYTAYIPLLERVAEKGYTSFICKMPGNLAVLGINRGEAVIENHPEITKWFIAGHSLGGAMASSFASKHSQELAGIIFMGAYPSSDISNTDLSMLSLKGSEDIVVNQDKYERAKKNAPANAKYITIEGGNHAGFGDYGKQSGDGTAKISGSEQQELTAGYIAGFCEEN